MTTLFAKVLIRSHAEVEAAYTKFLRETQIPALAIAAFFLVSVGKTRLYIGTYGIMHNVTLFIISIAIVLYTGALLTLSSTFGRRELAVVSFGRLNLWVAVLLGVLLGIVSHYSINLMIHASGGNIRRHQHDIFNWIENIVLAPLREEAWFQLVLQTFLQRWGTVVGIGVTTVLFALYHLRLLDHLPVDHELVHIFWLSPALLILALIRRYFGSMLVLVVAHATTNAVAFALDPQASPNL